MLDTLWQDLRVGLRALLRRPGFTAAALLTLAFGIGASTAVFSVVNGVLLRPLGYADPDELVAIQTGSSEPYWFGSSEPEYWDLRRELTALEGIAAYTSSELTLAGDGEPVRIEMVWGTSSLLPLLGVEPVLGRTFTADEDEPGAPRVAVISHGLWVRRFGERPDVVGRRIRLDTLSVEVIGVMPVGFAFPGPEVEAWLPLQLDEGDPWTRNNHYMAVVGRLRGGAEPATASAQAVALAARSESDYPEYYGARGYRLRVLSLQELVVGDAETPLWVLLGAVGFLLLIACVNVANLLLARGEGRRGELAVRAAIGAGRGRLAGQLVTENALLVGAGGVLGLALAVAAVRAFVALAPAGLPRVHDVRVDGAALAFALLITAAVALAFGALPAWLAARAEAGAALRRTGGRSGGAGGARRAGRALVVAQVALAAVLLVGAAVMARTVLALNRLDPGVRIDDVLTLRVNLVGPQWQDEERRVLFYRELLERVEALPGVLGAGAGIRVPMGSGDMVWSIEIEGQPVADVGAAPAELVVHATPGFHEALGTRIVRGRAFTAGDDASSPLVALVNESFAGTYWPGESPLGKRFRVFSGDAPWMQVVGVVADVRELGVTRPPRPTWYVPHAQGWRSAYFSPPAMHLVIHTGVPPERLVGPVRAALREMEPGAALSRVRTMRDLFGASLATQRALTALLAVFGVVALFLAAVGVYGVIAFAVSRRTRELGLHLAIGATPRRLLRDVVREGAGLAAIGAAAGLLAALPLARVLGSVVFGVSPRDPASFAGVAAVLVLVAIVATLIPARRAAGTDPMEALRAEG